MDSYVYEGILRHMHSHADQMDLLNDALADDNLEAGKLPARWLWRHETMTGVPDDWQPYLADMRQAARDVESATDLATARAAATRISENCQACHSAVGMDDSS
jgi:cytochrome c556